MSARSHLIDEQEIAWLLADHAEQRCLCDRLERIADELPDCPHRGEAAEISAALRSAPSAHFQRKTDLFSRLADASLPDSTRYMIDEIVRNHCIDAAHADDLASELEHAQSAHVGQLSYMLRCFFDGCRRAMMFEEVALLKLGTDRLTATAKAAVIDSLGTRKPGSSGNTGRVF